MTVNDLTLPIVAGLAAVLLVLPAIVIFWRQHRHWRAAERARARAERETRTIRAALETAPDGYFAWILPDVLSSEGSVPSSDPTSGGECSRRLAVLLDLFRGRSSTFADVLESFDKASQDQMKTAAERLRQEGFGFALDLALASGQRRIAVRGLRAADDDGNALADVIWMSDVTEGAAAVEALNDETAHLRRERTILTAALDGIDAPVWLRDDDLSLIYCNRAYVRAVDARDASDVVSRGREIAPRAAVREARALAAAARAAGETRRSPFHMVFDGTRRMVEVTESPVAIDGDNGKQASLFSDGSGRMTAGIAYDITRQEELETRLKRAQAAQSDVLERLGTAIAIFGPDTRMNFHNAAFTRLWRIDESWLGEMPTYAALLDVLRSQRRLPEVADFPAFKEKELSRFNSLIDPIEDVLHLPDGGSLRRVVAPHPLGGLLTTYEDVTDKLALERSYNTLIAVQRETIDNLQEAVAVFGADGVLRIANPSFADLWGLSLDALSESPGLANVVDAFEDMFDDADVFVRHRGLLLSALEPETQRITQQGRLVRSAGSVLEFIAVPLPDGGILFCYNDVSAPERAAQTLRGRAEILTAGERLKSDLAARLSVECTHAIDGIVELAATLAEASSHHPKNSDASNGIIRLAQDIAAVMAEARDLAAVDLLQHAPRLDSVDVKDAFERAMKLVRRSAAVRGCALQTNLPAMLGWVVADPKRFKLVMFLMLSSAVEASNGTSIRLEAVRRAQDSTLELRLRFLRDRQTEDAGRMAYELAKRLAVLDGGALTENIDGAATVLIWRHPLGTAGLRGSTTSGAAS